MEENLLCEIDEGLAEMRLLIEGAAALYANGAESLAHMAMEADRLKEANALETIGTALYALLKRICAVQDARDRCGRGIGAPRELDDRCLLFV